MCLTLYLSANDKIQIPICCPCTFFDKSSSEKLWNYQLIVFCVIMSLILVTNLFYKVMI